MKIKNIYLSGFCLAGMLLSSCVNTTGCYYDTPKAALEKLCKGQDCLNIVKTHLPPCADRMRGKMSTELVHEGKTQKAKKLTFEIMDEIIVCMSTRQGNDLSSMFPVRASYSEVDYKVRSKTFVTEEKCLNKDCSKKMIVKTRPFIGTTKNLFEYF